jgi:ABC-type lipoprotein export system ATPase subunit
MHFKDFKFYIKDKLVLSFSDYEVKKGVNLIFGPSGSGKTTFFKFLYILANKGPEYIGKFLGNFVKYEGQVQIDDKVEVCFQEFSLINDLSVKDNFKIFW